MKLMAVQDAVGQVLCHDITQIIKGVTKDAVFRKGHIITEEDIAQQALYAATASDGESERERAEAMLSLLGADIQ